MTDAVTQAATILKEHRKSIDRLDAILVYTLGERFKHTQAVGKLKALHNLPPSDPTREATQIARLEEMAKEAELDPDFAKAFLNFVIQEVIRHHRKQQE
ncbi:chorismate mutase [Ruegeria arenilitoris]|uniref:chorismate mutase n=1 Tax=Ruegeria arenilitoris TaxID=1173585 RepID=UPI001480DC1E|nr:chorismate mutase [Ruegeria arenilitoris]